MTQAPRRPQILLLAKAYPPVVGGVESYSQAVAHSYLARGYEVTVLTQTTGPTGWQTRHAPQGKVQLFNTGAGPQAYVMLRFLMALRPLLRHTRFALCHATTWRPALALLPWLHRIRDRTPLILTVHGREVMNYPAALRPAMIHILRRADQVVSVSHATQDVARAALHGRKPHGRWHVAYNGLSFATSAQRTGDKTRASNPPRLLTIARQVPRKNLARGLHALATLRDEGWDFHYDLVGQGSEQTTLRALTARLRLEDRVSFLGFRPDADLPALYHGADIFLHPQTHDGDGQDFEGFGLVIADAMSFGCAVLAGQAGGPAEVVADGRTGLLVDGREQQQITDALRRLLRDAALRQRLGSAARTEALHRFSWDRHVGQILSGDTALTPSETPLPHAAARPHP